MIELLLPRTDAGALAQLIVVLVVWIGLLVAVRRSVEARLLVGGVGMVILAWFALRTVH